MILWWASALAPGASLRIRAAAALAFCIGIEVSQLYHTPELDALRASTLGSLVLGSDFDPRDIAAYTVGVLAAAFFEGAVLRRFGFDRVTT